MKTPEKIFVGLLVAIVVTVGLATSGRSSVAPRGGPSFAELRRAHPTRLRVHGPSPQTAPREVAPPGVEEVQDPSGDLKLKAWYSYPANHPPGPCPAVVFFHGGFACGAEDWVPAFNDAGFALMLPMLRGENGNPGDFELFYGEVDDGRAAVRWLAAQEGIDPNRIFTFGHSAGGGVSALLSLYDEPRVRATGSSGGLYPDNLFDGWARQGLVPFDPSDRLECDLRLLVRNLDKMRVPHWGYIGKGDRGLVSAESAIRSRAASARAPLTVELVPGDHLTSLPGATARFIETIRGLP